VRHIGLGRIGPGSGLRLGVWVFACGVGLTLPRGWVWVSRGVEGRACTAGAALRGVSVCIQVRTVVGLGVAWVCSAAPRGVCARHPGAWQVGCAKSGLGCGSGLHLPRGWVSVTRDEPVDSAQPVQSREDSSSRYVQWGLAWHVGLSRAV
jgi:hypothetical protein